MELQGNKLRECDKSKTSEQDKATGYHWFLKLRKDSR